MTNCTGTRYLINPEAPEEGTDIRHEGPCPAHLRTSDLADVDLPEVVDLVLALFDLFDGYCEDPHHDRIYYDLPGGAGLVDFAGLLGDRSMRTLRECLIGRHEAALRGTDQEAAVAGKLRDVRDVLTPEQQRDLDADLREIARCRRAAEDAAATITIGGGDRD